MKEYILNNAEAQLVDRTAIDTLGIPGLELMQRAGSFVSMKAKKILKHVPGSHVAIFCGTGNNGGDGFVAARQLFEWGASVDIWLSGIPDKIVGDALYFYKKCSEKPIRIISVVEQKDLPSVKQIAESDLIIDALLGTGFKGEVRGIIRNLIELINASKCPVLSVDIPSGVSGDTAQTGEIAVQATRTVTMGFLKRGLMFQPGKRLAGDIVLADLKYPPQAFSVLEHETYLIDKPIVQSCIPVIFDNTYKHLQGKVLIFAGSPGMTGAAYLVAQGALRSGAGLVINAVPVSLNPIMEVKTTETLTLPLPESTSGTFCHSSLSTARDRIDWSDVIVFGPGVSSNDEVRDFGINLLRTIRKPVIVDADGLRVFHDKLGLIQELNDLIITPHLGEFSALSGYTIKDIKANIIDIVREFVQKYPCTLVLKGAPTIVVSPNGELGVNSSGNPGLATGGTGDVLTGLIAGLRAQKMPSYDAAICAVFIHGLAGDLGRNDFGVRGLIAGDLLNYIPGILKEFEEVQ